MEILVKSFNRPYYLERCIRSIYKFVEGEFVIKILDDGTPEKYLNKINQLFPEVIILKSELYSHKVQLLENHIAYKEKFNLFIIPTKLWVDSVTNTSKIFLMMEDDMWFKESLCLSKYEEFMLKSNTVIAKLYWGGYLNDSYVKLQALDAEFEEFIPNIPNLPLIVLDLIFFNKFKIGSILYRLGLIKDGIHFQLPFYVFYSVASAFFDKDYWLNLWDIKQGKADESHQLLKATDWFRKNKSRSVKSVSEKTGTSFITSATNMYKDIDLDIFVLNHLINEAWYNNKLDSMTNFPYDFKLDDIKFILDEAGDRRSTSSNWILWVSRFKAQYRGMGVVAD